MTSKRKPAPSCGRLSWTWLILFIPGAVAIPVLIRLAARIQWEGTLLALAGLPIALFAAGAVACFRSLQLRRVPAWFYWLGIVLCVPSFVVVTAIMVCFGWLLFTSPPWTYLG
jgi:hypothetical protein